MRKLTRQIRVGNVLLGGGAPIAVQSMTNTKTEDIESTVAQIKALEQAGCEIVRVAVPNIAAAKAITQIKKRVKIPVVADIHFDPQLAVLAAEAGADKLRINPGNIGSRAGIERVVSVAKKRGIPIRIGVNAGSLEKELLQRFGGPTAEAMVESALRHVRLLEDLNFRDIVISLKASDVPKTLAAYHLLAQKCDYPLHIGITEAGTVMSGAIKSAVGLGILLYSGVGDTLRVSLTGDPVYEVRVGWEILKALHIRQRGPVLISCPTCGRCQIDLIKIAEEVERELQKRSHKCKVAVMGCVVNGPGEAKEADFGIAGGRGQGILFKKGKIIKNVPEEEMVKELMKCVDELTLEEVDDKERSC